MFDGRNITSGLPDELVKVVDFLNEKASAGEFEFSDSVSYWENNEHIINPSDYSMSGGYFAVALAYGEFYQFNLSSCIRQQNSLTAQFVSFSLSNLANIFYPPPNFYNN